MDGIISKLDELLEEDKNFSTRTGLKLAMQALKEAMEFISVEKKAREEAEKREIIITETVRTLKEDVVEIDRKMQSVYPFYRAGIWVANAIGLMIIALLFKILFP